MRLAAVFLLSICLQVPTAQGEAPPQKGWSLSGRYKGYNLIVISVTNVGASRMSLYGYRRRTTPKLDAWAGDALVFDNAFSHASWTLPVGVSVFSSVYPYSHRIFIREMGNVLSEKFKTLPEVLRDHGYRTGAFTGGLDYFPGFSHMRGFQDAAPNPNFSSFGLTIAQAQKWLSSHSREKFMLFLQGYDAHCPFQPSEPFKGKFSDIRGKRINIDPTLCVRGIKASNDYTATYAGGCPQFPKEEKCPEKIGRQVRLTQDDIDYLGDLYDEKVLETDSLVGAFLRSLDEKLFQKTIVVVFSDHGEMFAKHGRFGRAGTRRGTSYDDVLHVPLIVRFPGGPSRRIGGLVQLIDLMPTLLDALALPVPATAQGRSLAPLVQDGTPVNRYVYAGSPYNVQGQHDAIFNIQSRGESIRDMKWKLIQEVLMPSGQAKKEGAPAGAAEGSFELYDIAADTEEAHEVSGSHPEVVADMRESLESWSKGANAAAQAPRTKKVPEELLRKAKERGYWQ